MREGGREGGRERERSIGTTPLRDLTLAPRSKPQIGTAVLFSTSRGGGGGRAVRLAMTRQRETEKDGRKDCAGHGGWWNGTRRIRATRTHTQN